MQLGNALAIIALIPLYGFGVGLHLDLIDTGEMFHIENLVKNADLESQSNSLLSNAFMSTDVEGLIQHASISLGLVKVLVDPSIEEPNSGDEYFDNLINECRFHSDESIEGNTCVLCKLVDPEINDVIAKGVIELPDGYEASDKVTIEFDEPADVMEAKGIKIKVVQNDIGFGELSSGDIIVGDDDTDAITKVDPVTEIQTIISQDSEFHDPENVVVDSNVDAGVIFPSIQEAFAGGSGPQVTVTKSVDKSIVVPNTMVTYSYTVQNTGDVILICTILEDDQLSNPIRTYNQNVSPGNFLPQHQEQVVINADVTNEATITCFFEGPNGLTQIQDTVSESVDVVNPAATIVKTAAQGPNFNPFVDPLQIVAGTQVQYQYVITNTGDVALNNCQLDDDVLGQNLSQFSLVNNGAMATVVTPAGAINADITNTGSIVNCQVPTTMGDILPTVTDTAFVDVVVQRTCEEIFAMDG